MEISRETIKTSLAHDISDEWWLTPPTCLEQGHYKSEEYCNTCSRILNTTEIYFGEPLGHQWDDGHITNPTCTEAGVKIFTCERDNTHTTTEIIPALGHQWDDGAVTKEPTCTEAGIKTFTCKRTGCSQTKTEDILVLGHAYSYSIDTKDPTCESDGYTNLDAVCSRCGESNKIRGPRPALGHKWDDGAVTKEPTCTEAGIKTFTCKRTGCSHTTTEEIPALGHAYGDWTVTKAATCEEEGEAKRICANDENHKETKVIPALGHTRGKPVIKNKVDPTCEEGGHYDEAIYCETCNEELQKVHHSIRPLGHIEGVPVRENETAPTCTEAGGHYDITRCERCNTLLAEKHTVIPETGHDWEHWNVEKPATEKEEGIEKRICKNDSTHIETRMIPTLDHVHGLKKVEEKPATCIHDGIREHWECVGGAHPCRRYFADDRGKTELEEEDLIIKAAGHKEGSPVKENEVAPTCEKDGSYEEVIHCKVCNEELSRTHKIIEPTGHQEGKPVRIKVLEPTCEHAGHDEVIIYCQVCNAELERDRIDIHAIGHDWGDWKVEKASTEKEEGVEKRICKNDSTHVETRAIPMLFPASLEKPEDEPTNEPAADPSEEPTKEPKAESDGGQATTSIFYYNSEGDGLVWYKGSGDDAYFVFKRSVDDHEAFSHYTGILIDGKEVDPKSYTAESGSVIVTLKDAYLETLEIGKHTMTTMFEDGNDVAVRFNVANKVLSSDGDGYGTRQNTSINSSPKTGDATNLWIFVTALILSILVWIKIAVKKDVN